MAFEINIDQDTQVARITMRGRSSSEEMMEILEKLAVEGTFETSKRLWDVRRANADLSSAELEHLARAARSRDGDGPARVAIVAVEDVVFGLSRIFEVHRESEDVKVQVFRDLEEAQIWLGEAE